MHIIITGTRGIPNHHGGFERFAEEVARRWAAQGHRVEVYNPAGHPFSGDTWQGIKILRKPLPHHILGKFAVLTYDRLCLRDAYCRRPDVILNCGHGNAFFIRKKYPIPVVTLTDGLEWKRAGWHPLVRCFFRQTEKTAVKRSRAVVADHPEIARWLKKKYGISPEIISYGAEIPPKTFFKEPFTPRERLKQYLRDKIENSYGVTLTETLLPGRYFMTITRFVPENNLHIILEGYANAGIPYPLLLIGDPDNRYGKKLLKKYAGMPQVLFTGPVYNKNLLTLFIHYSRGYLHGHSSGGTNPALLEAMAAGGLIAAHDNPFNRYVLGKETLYFSSTGDVSRLLKEWDTYLKKKDVLVRQNQERIRQEYSWEKVAGQYLKLFGTLTGD
ncbi:MAG TPA: DUF1972 domain-containing protein [Bacteroidetes bacterium]|nr:DUF1972 domain-containing protein [Bacteroidota bacterium]